MTVYIFAGTVHQAAQYGRRALTTDEYGRSSIITIPSDLRGRRWARGDQLHYVGTFHEHRYFIEIEDEIRSITAVSVAALKIVYEDQANQANPSLDPVPDVDDLEAVERWLG